MTKIHIYQVSKVAEVDVNFDGPMALEIARSIDLKKLKFKKPEEDLLYLAWGDKQNENQ
jgi:hypothetical protein